MNVMKKEVESVSALSATVGYVCLSFDRLSCPESSRDCGSLKHLVAINEKTHFYAARPVLILMKQCRKFGL